VRKPRKQQIRIEDCVGKRVLLVPRRPGAGGPLEVRVVEVTAGRRARIMFLTGTPRRSVWLDFAESPDYRVLEVLPERPTGDFSFLRYLRDLRHWSHKTFGPNPRPHGLLSYFRKENNAETEGDRTLLSLWIDMVIVGLDGAWRTGAEPETIIWHLIDRASKNYAGTLALEEAGGQEG